jgi:3-dehydrosphinganine reductase
LTATLPWGEVDDTVDRRPDAASVWEYQDRAGRPIPDCSTVSRVSGQRHAIVTGGSRGLGRSIAALLAARGDRVSLIARDLAQLQESASSMRGHVRCAVADVTDRAELDHVVAGLVDQSGPCDVLVAAAGAAEPGYFAQLGDDVFRRQIELNYFGVLNAVRTVTPSMIERRTGSLIAVASAAALVGVFGYSAYAPSKFAVRGLMEVLRCELKPQGIHVACVFPPDMDTPGFAAENLTKPEECARISSGIKPRHPDDVARAVLRGLDRRRFMITADPQTALLARAAGILSPVLHRVFDRTVRDVSGAA